MGVGRIFSRGGSIGFSRSSQKDFSMDEPLPIQNRKTIPFANNLIGKCQIATSRGTWPPGPPSDAHATYHWN